VSAAATPAHPAHRGSIELEPATIIAHEDCGAGQYVLRLQAPRTAARAEPGSFAHLSCADWLPMRRPISIMRASREGGWIELLYKVVGRGTAALARRKVGEALSCLGPIGRGFVPDPARPRALLVGGGVGIPPMVFLAERLRADARARWQPLVLMGSEVPFRSARGHRASSCPASPMASSPRCRCSRSGASPRGSRAAPGSRAASTAS
jgi:dihydroorotate dehydrogenase electron transfer subunit